MNENYNEKIDLHIHSTYSDGLLNPDEIVAYMEKNKVGVISITDHNSIEAYKHININTNTKIVIGVEIDVIFNDHLQLLCYGFDIYTEEIRHKLSRLRGERVTTGFRLLRKLKKLGIKVVDETEVFKSLNNTDTMCQILINSGVNGNIDEVKRRFFSSGAPLYYKLPCIEAVECISMIHNNKGYVVLAHPGRIRSNINEIKTLVSELYRIGLDGIECYHPEHTPELADECVKIAKKYGLFITGGSDMHYNETNYCIDIKMTDTWF